MIVDAKYNYITGVIDDGRMLINADIGMDIKHFDLKGNEVHVQEFAVVAPENESYKPSTVSPDEEEKDNASTIDLYAAGSIGQEGWTVTIERAVGRRQKYWKVIL